MSGNDLYDHLEKDFENRLQRSLSIKERWFVQWMAGCREDLDSEIDNDTVSDR